MQAAEALQHAAMQLMKLPGSGPIKCMMSGQADAGSKISKQLACPLPDPINGRCPEAARDEPHYLDQLGQLHRT